MGNSNGPRRRHWEFGSRSGATLARTLRTQITKAGLVVMDKIWDNGFR
jgi:hypothetical protein